MKTLKGTLRYLGRNRGWLLVNDEKETDLRPIFRKVFEKLHGKPTTLDTTNFLISIYQNRRSSQIMDFFEEDGEDMTILKSEKPADNYKNVVSIISRALQRLNGRKVFVESDEEKITLHSDDCLDNFILGLYLSDNGYCKIPPGKERSVCKMDEENNSCLFLVKDAAQFFCCKFELVLAEMLLAIYDNKTLPKPTRRIGNCALLGKER
ncbi:MAG: hypothetical protein PHT44_03530 [Candidatus Portnoybacteria bacterium]|nr:hypothetical protein [Candidatus Portnoybacteria bacterium]MDD4983101.1 hypothetical protein [Candidatus Portnoybacteria bacterium]